MRINHNIAALHTYNRLSNASKQTMNSAEKLASGLRINQAKDDAAGLAISEKMRGQIRGLAQAERNVKDGISLLQTAESGLAKVSNPHLQRLRELAVQAANGTLTNTDRVQIQAEVGQIKKSINDIANNTEFNSIKLLNVGKSEPVKVAKEIEVTVQPGEQLVAGYINVLPSNTEPLTVEAMFGTISGAEWPDMNIISPTGHEFGYSGTMGGSSTQTIGATDSASSATYNGYAASNEAMTFNDPIEGIWQVEIRNTGGISSSTFSLKSNLGIQLTSQSVTSADEDENSLTFQVGANTEDHMKVELTDVRTVALGIDELEFTSQTKAEKAISIIDEALAKVTEERSKFGAYQNALEHTENNIGNTMMNLTAAESRIRDTDIAKELTERTKHSILVQSAQAMLVHANQQPQAVLQLLRQ
ncbi:flagellin N-terminal helical domain-containing protein [Planococcus lenghuensis]|uniref:Flagellin n=1 Tax=Planococcus lenghuensis TaxID=2213202 RepID=A0A1Q2L162_9BACL|nr:flagellin [Planococcus lenghuensis]AQQ54153.1 hypothetical protein B0X71_14250 [Planococcus lenghuensis]